MHPQYVWQKRFHIIPYKGIASPVEYIYWDQIKCYVNSLSNAIFDTFSMYMVSIYQMTILLRQLQSLLIWIMSPRSQFADKATVMMAYVYNRWQPWCSTSIQTKLKKMKSSYHLVKNFASMCWYKHTPWLYKSLKTIWVFVFAVIYWMCELIPVGEFWQLVSASLI